MQASILLKNWLQLIQGRYVMWHIKDMDKITRDYSELGNGSINYHDILPDPVASGLEFFYIEQGGNYAVNSKESAAIKCCLLQKGASGLFVKCFFTNSMLLIIAIDLSIINFLKTKSLLLQK